MNELLNFLNYLARSVNLELFVVVGSFLEEIIAPIPSPFVMTTAAVIAQEQSYSWLALGFVVLLASAAKTLSSVVIYKVADQAEDIVVSRFGKFVGITPHYIERIGALFSGKWWDDVIMVVVRSLPFVPSVVVSVAAGVIKYEMKSYLWTTFVGNIVRSLFYLWIAYVGVRGAELLWDQIKQSPLFIGAVIIGVGILGYAAIKIKDTLSEEFFKQRSSHSKK